MSTLSDIETTKGDSGKDTDKNSVMEAAFTIQHFVRRTKKLRAVHTKLVNMNDMLEYVLQVLQNLESSSFESATAELLRNERFYQALMGFLAALPRDPNLKSNYQRAKNFKIITMSLVVAKHPNEVLLQEVGAAYTPQAVRCREASEVLLKSMRRLCQAVLQTHAKGGHRSVRYRNAFLVYRYAIRSYLQAFDAWKTMDQQRLVKNAEEGFMQCYSVYLDAKAGAVLAAATGLTGPDGVDPETKMAVFASAEQQMQRIRGAVLQLLVGGTVAVDSPSAPAPTPISAGAGAVPGFKPDSSARARAEARLEELSATVEASSAAYHELGRFEAAQRAAAAGGEGRSPSQSPARSRATSTSSFPDKAANSSGVGSDSGSDSSGITGGARALLDNLSRLAGADHDKLAYEIMLDKFYRLPSSGSSSSSSTAWQQSLKQLPRLSELPGDDVENEVGMGSVDVSTESPLSMARAAAATAAAAAGGGVGGSGNAEAPQIVIGEVIKLQLLRSIGDKLINSLRQSNVKRYGQVRPGVYIPVYYCSNQDMLTVMEHSHARRAAVAAAESTEPILASEDVSGIPVHTACVLAVRPRPQQEQGVTDTSEEVAAATKGLGLGKGLGLMMEMDLWYPADDTRENGVLFERVKLASHGADPVPLLSALDGLCKQIAGLVPNRADMVQSLVQSIDFPLLTQMIVNGALSDPATDLLPILAQFQTILRDLQAPSRVADTQRWIERVQRQFSFKPLPSTGAGVAAAASASAASSASALAAKSSMLSIRLPADETEDARGNAEAGGGGGSGSAAFGTDKASLDDVLPHLPAFFERASEVVEEIQRDMANYYISLLAPVLQEHGASFIASRFMQRVQAGQQSMTQTARWLAQQLGSGAGAGAEAGASSASSGSYAALCADVVEALGVTAEQCSLQHIAQATAPAASTPPAAAAASAAATAPASTMAVNRSSLAQCIVARSFISLLLQPVRLDAPPQQIPRGLVYPETLQFDRVRLASLRDRIDIISIECSLVISTRQMLARYGLHPLEEEEIEMQHRLDVLLTEKDVSFATVTTEVYKYVEFAVHRARSRGSGADGSGNSANGYGYAAQTSARPATDRDLAPPDSPHTPPAAVAAAAAALRSGQYAHHQQQQQQQQQQAGSVSAVGENTALRWFDADELRKAVEKAVRDVLSAGNPVLSLFTKRLCKVLLRALSGQPYLHKLPAYSLHSKGQERNISRLVQSAQQLFDHTYRIFGPLYRSVLHAEAERQLRSA